MGYFEKKEIQRREQEKYYREKTNLRLKWWAIAAISIAIILLVSTIFMMDSVTIKTILIMRGCAGLFALIFVVLVGILVFRVNNAYIRDRRPPHRSP